MAHLDTVIYLAGLVLVVGALAGGGFLAVTELRLRAMRRTRLATAGAAPGAPRPQPSGVLAGQVMAGVKRLGQQSAVRDPAKVSLLRSRLIQAGFHSKEAPV